MFTKKQEDILHYDLFTLIFLTHNSVFVFYEVTTPAEISLNNEKLEIKNQNAEFKNKKIEQIEKSRLFVKWVLFYNRLFKK